MEIAFDSEECSLCAFVNKYFEKETPTHQKRTVRQYIFAKMDGARILMLRFPIFTIKGRMFCLAGLILHFMLLILKKVLV